MTDLLPAALGLVSGQVNQGKMAHSGPIRLAVPNHEDMTTAPKEINAAAIKNSATEKHTPMMQHYLRVDTILF